MRQDLISGYNELRDSLDNRWWCLLQHCNLYAVPLPNNLAVAKKIMEEQPYDGIILTGGGEHTKPPQDVRSQIESALISDAIKSGKRLLGVCRGMQAIQMHFGMQMQPLQGHIAAAMKIDVDGEQRQVNSYHQYGTHSTSPQLQIWAKSPDGVIKAIRHRVHQLQGIMWHPERETPFSPQDIQFLRDYFGKA